jgi:hypothetical protein
MSIWVLGPGITTLNVVDWYGGVRFEIQCHFPQYRMHWQACVLGLPNHSMDIRIWGSIFDIQYSILSKIWRFGRLNMFDGSIFDYRTGSIWSNIKQRFDGSIFDDRISNFSNYRIFDGNPIVYYTGNNSKKVEKQSLKINQWIYFLCCKRISCDPIVAICPNN